MQVITEHWVGDRLIEGAGTAHQDWLNWSGLHQLKPLDLSMRFPVGKRVVVIAPHPDDEILGCAGLLQQLADLQREIILVAVSNGTQSHPDSQMYTPEQLNTIRPAETQQALETLGISHRVKRIALNFMDGEISRQKHQLQQALTTLLSPDDILVSTFDQDGHPDHEATGQVVQQLANDTHLICYQVLIWAWHWASPNDQRIPWHKTLKLPLSAQQLHNKHKAIGCFKSQLEVDHSTAQPPVLSKQTVQRMLMPYEVYRCG